MALRILLIFALSGILLSQSSFGNQFASRGIGGLEAVSLSSIRDSSISPLGQAALSIRPSEWKHAETENFVYHYFNSFIATPVSVEAEFYYRVTAKELHRDTQEWQRKCHIFIFEDPMDWNAFKQMAALDPWTGGVHVNGELFIVRNPKFKYKGDTLGHEIVHLVPVSVFRTRNPSLVKRRICAIRCGSRVCSLLPSSRLFGETEVSSGAAPALYASV